MLSTLRKVGLGIYNVVYVLSWALWFWIMIDRLGAHYVIGWFVVALCVRYWPTRPPA